MGKARSAATKCMIVKAFVDTNVLVYAYDRASGAKRELARGLLEALRNEGRGVLSTQVLQEFYVNVRRNARPPVSQDDARALVSDYLAWEPVVNDGASVLEAIDVGHRYQLSFRDALIVVSARKAGASVLYSEDLNHGQTFESVQVLNPLLETGP